MVPAGTNTVPPWMFAESGDHTLNDLLKLCLGEGLIHHVHLEHGSTLADLTYITHRLLPFWGLGVGSGASGSTGAVVASGSTAAS